MKITNDKTITERIITDGNPVTPEVRVKNAATSPMNTAIAMVFIESPASVASSRPNVPPLPRILR